MMLFHYYTARTYGDAKIKLACTGEWVKAAPKKGTMQIGNGAKMFSRVTCKECLKIILPREEAKLQKQLNKLWAIQEGLNKRV